MTSPHKRFFTWVEEPYFQRADVPDRIRAHMRVLWLNGARVEELAKTFKMPVEWIEVFVRETDRTTKPN
jgi:hypothetical protein